jgi:hypothetical protein
VQGVNRVVHRHLLSLFALSLLACSTPSDDEKADYTEDDFSSREAVLVDFEFDGQLVTDSDWNPTQSIQDQFLYTIGQLNADRSVGRLDSLVLSNVQTSSQPDGTWAITYHAKMPVGWGNRASIPPSYTFTLPKNASSAGQEAFTTKYKATCVDFSAHDVDAGSMWYYYRPHNGGCALGADDIVTFTATVTKSIENTTGKYPEYTKVWEDDELRVVAIFGKYEEGATDPSDAGISAFNEFIGSMRSTLGALSLTTEPASVPVNPGVATPDVTFHAQLDATKKITVNALLVDKISTAPESFYTRYEGLSAAADIIAYNGHAGLGQNVRALAHRGKWTSGKYLMLFMNGCDTFAYVDGSLAQTRAPLNPDDPSGTKYMDIVTNAMPAYFMSDSGASTALIKGMMSVTSPMTYEQMFQSIDTSQVVLVTGEEDNVFEPGDPIGSGGGGGGGAINTGISDSGTIARGDEKRYATPELAAGTYTFKMTGTGDADLYVKTGAAVSTNTWDCRPYTSSSNETCTVTLAAKQVVNVMVRGYAATSTFTIVGTP